MKKLISLIIVMVMMLSYVVGVSAYSPYLPGSDGYERLEKLKKEITPLFSEHFSEKTNGCKVDDLDIIHLGVLNGATNDEYVLVGFVTDSDKKQEVMYRLGEFVVVSKYESPLYKDGMAVYTKNDGQWHSLSYIYENDFEEFMYIVHQHQTPALIGCLPWFVTGKTHYDIRFATTIQKTLAGIDDGVNSETMRYLDMDNDGEVTIKDATAVQKYIAGLGIEVFDSIV